jgi:hypothetical protein
LTIGVGKSENCCPPPDWVGCRGNSDRSPTPSPADGKINEVGDLIFKRTQAGQIFSEFRSRPWSREFRDSLPFHSGGRKGQKQTAFPSAVSRDIPTVGNIDEVGSGLSFERKARQGFSDYHHRWLPGGSATTASRTPQRVQFALQQVKYNYHRRQSDVGFTSAGAADGGTGFVYGLERVHNRVHNKR